MVYARHPANFSPKSNNCFLSWIGEKVPKAMYAPNKESTPSGFAHGTSGTENPWSLFIPD